MTIAEIQRYINGATWRMKVKAQYDYQMANLIGISCGRMLSSDVDFPQIEEVYPDLFQDELSQKQKEQKEEEDRMIKSQNNFMAFALRFNAQKRGDETKQ